NNHFQALDPGNPFEFFDMDAFVMGSQQAASADDGHNSTGDGFVHFQDANKDHNGEFSGDRVIDDCVAGTSGTKRKRNESDEEGRVSEKSSSKRLR
ncbi:hypothetical protein N0V85_009470, partial [Neurospora sp. IMI 360204]